MQTKRRIPLLAALVITFGLMGGAMAQAEEGGPGGGGGGGGMPLDPVICALTGGGEACSGEPGQPSEPGQPGEPGEPGGGDGSGAPGGGLVPVNPGK